MRLKKRFCHLICLWGGLLGLMTGCVPGRQQPTASPTVATTTSPTTSSQPMTTYTPTSVATLSPAEGRARVLELLANNGGCRLPCWWGITPGQTSWESAKSFFLQFDPEIWSRLPFAEVEIPSENGFYGDLNQIGVRFVLRDNLIISMKIGGLEDGPYSIQEFLAAYGKPEEMWVHTYSQDAGDDLPFIVLLFYPTKGFAAMFDADVEKEPMLRGCLERKAGLFLWNPLKRITLKEFGEMFGVYVDEHEPYLSLEEATGMDIDTFYRTYKGAQGPVCLETPRDLWPNPFGP